MIARSLPAALHGRWSRQSARARAMYLGNTVYRIHGTNAPETIGQAVSSGCFRLVNDDVADLYSRVAVGTTLSCGRIDHY